MPRVDDPLTLFERWLEAARASMGYDADAMVVATATADGAPSARMVLLKGVDERGLVFFTNYSSRKGAELAGNPRAALLFYWHPLGRQVRVEGAVSRADRAESEAYAHSRPRQSQLSALASPQSEVVPDRDWLERPRRGARPRAPGGRPPAARRLGRLPRRARHLGVLGEPRQPAARPPSLHAHRGRLAVERLAP